MQGPCTISDDEVSPSGDRQERFVGQVFPTAVKVGELRGGVPCVVYEATTDLVVTTVSSNSLELIRIHPENIIGKCLLSGERILAQDCSHLQHRIEQLRPLEIASTVHKIADDQGLPVWVAHSLRKLQAGRNATLVGCMTPIACEVLAEKLESSIVSQFVHRIGNHFQLINLLIGSLKRSTTQVEEVEALQETVDRAVDFTRSFSHFTQPPVCVNGIDIADILSSAIKTAASACAEKNIVLQNVKGRFPLTGILVSGDSFLLEMAIGAVFQNALEATDGGGQIFVSGETDSESTAGRPIVRIIVADTGAGIDKEMAASACKPFVTSKRDRDGLGLSAAVRIVEGHGGMVKITSTPGQGTRVEIALPTTGSPAQAAIGAT